MWDSTEIIDPAHGLYFRWPCGVKGQGHNSLTRNITKTVDAMLDSREHLVAGPTGFDWHRQIWPCMTFRGQKSPSHFLTSNMWWTATDTMWNSTEIIDTEHGLYFRWLWDFKGKGHNPLIRNISTTVTYTRLDPREDFFESSHGLTIVTVRFDIRWPWGVKNQGHREWQKLPC